MRDNFDHLKPLRRQHPMLAPGDVGEGPNGLFVVRTGPYPDQELRIIASRDPRWEHVSVSLPHRCPTWGEMQMVKNLFWDDDEVVMQLHVAKKDHINVHPYCLHLWRPRSGKKIPLPPKEYV